MADVGTCAGRFVPNALELPKFQPPVAQTRSISSASPSAILWRTASVAREGTLRIARLSDSRHQLVGSTQLKASGIQGHPCNELFWRVTRVLLASSTPAAFVMACRIRPHRLVVAAAAADVDNVRNVMADHDRLSGRSARSERRPPARSQEERNRACTSMSPVALLSSASMAQQVGSIRLTLPE